MRINLQLFGGRGASSNAIDYKVDYQTYEKVNNRYVFQGWYKIDRNNIIEKKERNINGRKNLYIKNKLKSGRIVEYRYIIK